MDKYKKIYYKNTAILFRSFDGYFSITDICMIDGVKNKWYEYIKSDEARDCIYVLGKKYGIDYDDIINLYIYNGNLTTWVHPSLVIHFSMSIDSQLGFEMIEWVQINREETIRKNL